jgi:hypothetical protein
MKACDASYLPPWVPGDRNPFPSYPRESMARTSYSGNSDMVSDFQATSILDSTINMQIQACHGLRTGQILPVCSSSA